MFVLRKKKLSVKVKGLGNKLGNVLLPITYEVRVIDGDWSVYFSSYEPQRYGPWDTDCCWCLSTVNSVEDQLEWLWKNGMFSPEAKAFFTANGYLDTNGNISLSERFIEILSNNRNTGGSSEEAWQLMKAYGIIPRSMLEYTLERALAQPSQGAFASDYFAPSAVTQPMRDLGKKFLSYVSIAYQRIGTDWAPRNRTIMAAAVKQAPLCYGIPIPADVFKWNDTVVQYDGSTTVAHEVLGYNIPADGTYPIYDQYEPHLKTLSADYDIPYCTQGIVTMAAPVAINPTAQPKGEENDAFWTWVMAWWNGFRNPTIQIGSL